MSLNKVFKAFRIANEYHKGQLDSDGRPYIEHLFYVMLQMDTDEEKIVALLHDILEDTDYPLASIEKEFGIIISYAVYLLTHYEIDTYFEYIQRIKDAIDYPASSIARKVKIADAKHNLSKSFGQPSRIKRYSKVLSMLQE